jgi:adenylylsulfate kinase
MVEQPIPLIAEVESVYAAVTSGAQGIQLSAETAVGKHPLAAVSVVAAQIERVWAERVLPPAPAPVVWLLGLSGSGKTTLAERLRRVLAKEYGLQAELLDGDAVRAQDPARLGYSRADREANVQRIIHLAKLLSRNNVTTVVANISPYQHLRDLARAEIPGYLEVHLECPVEVCAHRDPKGLYARAARGEADHVVGVSEPFEPPLRPDLVVNTAQTTEEDAIRQILGCLRERWPTLPSVSG